MRQVALLVVAAVLLAGCSSAPLAPTPATPADATPAATPTESPTPAMPIVRESDTGIVRLIALEVRPDPIDVGLPLMLVATVVNDGPGTGGANVRFGVDGTGGLSVFPSSIPEGATREVFANLTQDAVGNFTAQAWLGNATLTRPFGVVGPRIVNLTLDATPVEPCGAVIIETTFKNEGSGRARSARADLRIASIEGTPIVDFATAIGDVAPGQIAESAGEIAEVRAVCAGEEPRPYSVRFVVHADGVPDVQLTGAFVA